MIQTKKDENKLIENDEKDGDESKKNAMKRREKKNLVKTRIQTIMMKTREKEKEFIGSMNGRKSQGGKSQNDENKLQNDEKKGKDGMKEENKEGSLRKRGRKKESEKGILKGEQSIRGFLMKKKGGNPTTPKRKIEEVENKDELIFGRLETPEKKIRLNDEKLVRGNGNRYLEGGKIFLAGRVKNIAGKFELLGKECIRKESNSKTTEILNLRNVMRCKALRKRMKRTDVFMKKEMKTLVCFQLMKSLII